MAGVEIGLGARAPSIAVMQISFIHTPMAPLHKQPGMPIDYLHM